MTLMILFAENTRAVLWVAVIPAGIAVLVVASLDEAADVVRSLIHDVAIRDDDRGGLELVNLHDVALGLLAAAAAREETRGAHTRSDFPTEDERFRLRMVLR
jgi:succinate dehydrogenase/fumarate reductase flavoprotein subunit